MLGDRYELDHEIGRVDNGSMWLGRDTVLNRTVAMKQIGMVSGGSAPDLVRAEREAHLAARVNHPNVVAVFDLVDDGHRQWLIMEYVDGPSLASLIAARGALEPEDLAPVVEQVASALAAAHEHGIVHRDVKPSNILLTKDGIAKLSDFGVARAHADVAPTQTGLLTGSPAYLSPEVATGGTATAASDVWSLGASLFHALAGHPPYEVSDNLLDAMYRIGHDEPPRLEEGGLLAPLVEAMMQRDPDARPSLAEIERAVAEITATSQDFADDGAEPTVDLELATREFPTVSNNAEPTPTSVFGPPATSFDSPTRVRASASARRESAYRRGSRRNLWLVAGVAAAIIAIVAFAVVVGGTQPPIDEPRAEPNSSQSTPSSADGDPTAKELEGFAADYLMTASNDPDEGFTLLTPAYQQESGGLQGYKDFWAGVSDLDVQTVRGDPEALTVSYTYSYDFKGDRHTEDVTLQLEESADSYLISGAT
ncbi:MAG: serine/threonine-protein kinase [Aeromicrobium sp.]